ncbi:MAG: cell wall hydrolase [bacterium]|nr:cell wall hydrolase [bacterium]
MLHLHSFLHRFHANTKHLKKGPCASIAVITVCTLACTSFAFPEKVITGSNSIKIVEASDSYLNSETMEGNQITSLLQIDEKSETTQDKNSLLDKLIIVDKKQAVIKEVMEQQAQIKCTQAREIENAQRELSIQKAKEQAEKEAKEKAAKEKAAKKGIINLSNAERTVLERIVEAEAGDQDTMGRMLVANVVMNRVKSKEFPNSVKGVVYEHSGSCYQFSPVMSGYINKIKVSKTTKEAVDRVLKGEDESKGALYFIQRDIAGKKGLSWFDRALTKLFKHGCHTFYK